MHFHGGGTLDGVGGPSLRISLKKKKNVVSKHERRDGVVSGKGEEGGLTENGCAIEAWISKETGGTGRRGEDPRNLFDFLFLLRIALLPPCTPSLAG